MSANRYQQWIVLGTALTVAFLSTAITMHWLNTPNGPVAGVPRGVAIENSLTESTAVLTGQQILDVGQEAKPAPNPFGGHLNLEELTGQTQNPDPPLPNPTSTSSVELHPEQPNRRPPLPEVSSPARTEGLGFDAVLATSNSPGSYANAKPTTNQPETEAVQDDEFVFAPVPQLPVAATRPLQASPQDKWIQPPNDFAPTQPPDRSLVDKSDSWKNQFESNQPEINSANVEKTSFEAEVFVRPSDTPQPTSTNETFGEIGESFKAADPAGPPTGTLPTQPGAPNPSLFQPRLAETGSIEPSLSPPSLTQPKTASSEAGGLPSPIEPASALRSPANSPNVPNSDHTLPHVLVGSKNFKLAEQPKLGEHYRDDRPITDPRAQLIETLEHDFSPGPNYEALPYLSYDQRQVYEGKGLYAVQRPLVELGRPWYQLGQLSPGYDWFGKHNTIAPQFIVYGDYRTSVASNSINGDNRSLIASELNLDLDLKLTGTERFHAFISPLDDGVNNTGYLLDEDEFVRELDANFDFGYFEGDLGAMAGGFMGETLPFDMPFAVGVMPLLFQNGIWMEDAFLGFATTIAARNSPRLNISNMDITFFAGYDKISSDAFPGDDSAARMYGIATFIEAMNGYFEIDYAFLDDRNFGDRSYHNFAFAYSRRYGRLISNSTRVIVNAGQSTAQGPNTADGVLLLSENSLISGAPSTLVPYFNFFAGFDRPQSAARAVQAGGVLRNTGILFESDGMTNYPTLDATANDTYGGALGINLIADDFSQQLVVEMAMLGVMGEDSTRNAPGEQMGIGFRYQLPLSNSLIFRTDGMYGFLNDQPDVRGLRFELRKKW